MNLRLLGAAALCAVLSGCGGAEPDPGGGGDVASLASAEPQQSVTPAAAERPLVRTDTSEKDEDRMWDLWQDCLTENGMPPKAELAESGRDDPRAKKAEAACETKQPEQVWERARRTDPAYADKLRDWVTCIRSHGIDAWEDDGFLAFESLPPENQMKKVDECQDKAFGKG